MPKAKLIWRGSTSRSKPPPPFFYWFISELLSPAARFRDFRQYLRSFVTRSKIQPTSSHSFSSVGQTQREQVAFRSSSKFQRSTPMRPAHLTSSVGLGETLLTGQTFQQFMGPLWDALRDKYGEWLNLTYSKSLDNSVCVSGSNHIVQLAKNFFVRTAPLVFAPIPPPPLHR